MSVAFFLTTLVVVATPGTGALYTITAGIARGRRASLIAAVGCTLGIVPHLVAAITGLAALLYASSVAFQTLRYLGVAYLLILAWRTYRDRTPLVVDDAVTPAVTAWSVIRKAVLINVLNPKLTVFFFAFLPQFVHPQERGAVPHMLALSAVFMLATLLVFAGYGIFAAAVRSHIVRRPRVVSWLRRVFAGSYVALAGRLGLVDR